MRAKPCGFALFVSIRGVFFAHKNEKHKRRDSSAKRCKKVLLRIFNNVDGLKTDGCGGRKPFAGITKSNTRENFCLCKSV